MRSFLLSLLMILTVAIAIPTESQTADLPVDIETTVDIAHVDIMSADYDFVSNTDLVFESSVESIINIDYEASDTDSESPPIPEVRMVNDSYIGTEHFVVERRDPLILKKDLRRQRE